MDYQSDRALISFVLSLAVHGFILIFALYFEPSEFVSKQDDLMEIVFQDPERQNEFVVTPPTNNKNEDFKPKKEVQLKSHSTNRTDLETVARPKNFPSLQAPVDAGGDPSQSQSQQKKAQNKSEGGDQLVQREELVLPGYGSTSSRPLIPDYIQQKLPAGVRLGNITSLNTDQHKFYSFNQRLLSQFVPIWGDRVRSALYQWLQENKPPSISKTWVTNVEVIMNEKGEIIDVQPFRLSGLWSIDNALIGAFKQIDHVPNPPAEMVDENGYIHLQFQAEVLWVPRPSRRVQTGNN